MGLIETGELQQGFTLLIIRRDSKVVCVGSLAIGGNPLDVSQVTVPKGLWRASWRTVLAWWLEHRKAHRGRKINRITQQAHKDKLPLIVRDWRAGETEHELAWGDWQYVAP